MFCWEVLFGFWTSGHYQYVVVCFACHCTGYLAFSDRVQQQVAAFFCCDGAIISSSLGAMYDRATPSADVHQMCPPCSLPPPTDNHIHQTFSLSNLREIIMDDMADAPETTWVKTSDLKKINVCDINNSCYISHVSCLCHGIRICFRYLQYSNLTSAQDFLLHSFLTFLKNSTFCIGAFILETL